MGKFDFGRNDRKENCQGHQHDEISADNTEKRAQGAKYQGIVQNILCGRKRRPADAAQNPC